MPNLTLYIDIGANQFVKSLLNSAPVNPRNLPFFFGDYVTLQVYLVQNVGNQGLGNSTYQIVPTTGLTLQCFIDNGEVDATIYTQQVNFNTDQNNQYFYAQLSLNTEELQNLLADNSQADATLKIGYIQNGNQPTTVFSGDVIIQVGMPTGALVVPPPLQALSVPAGDARYFPKQPVAGQALQLASPSGKVLLLYIIDNSDGTITLVQQPQ